MRDMTGEVLYNDASSLDEVVRMLKSGCVGVIPADTIYGLSACAHSRSAERIYEIKERPQNKSLITLASLEWLEGSGLEVPSVLYSHWPCPLTAILRAVDGTTHAVRVPDDAYIQAIVAAVGPIWSTSVNISGQASLSRAEDIERVFAGKIDFLVRKRDEEEAGLPSTLVDCTSKPFRVLRQGVYDASALLS